MSQNQQTAQTISVQYVDNPMLLETFADNIRAVHVDGTGLRIEFCVTRLDPFKTGETVSARSHPVCRLVLPGPAVADLISKMQQVGTTLAQKGLIKTAPDEAKIAATA
jgi:hypothetical protein